MSYNNNQGCIQVPGVGTVDRVGVASATGPSEAFVVVF